ncbi:MAG: PLP-dependent aspartate aminotransferase family protein [Clostridiales Family XIII bacterium]|nr:PLP-dependent aspartate aminotransferase family protein [Clostridiales Family XIII bacterium]
MDFETVCIHGKRRVTEATGALATPIYQSATFAHEGLDDSGATGSGYDYTRQQNPTREQLEYRIADLEGADEAFAFASGMAAITALMELFLPGDRIVASGDLYGGTYRLFDQVLSPKGYRFEYGRDTDALIALITEDTKAVFVETPTNPMMNLFDIRKIADAAKAAGALLIVDNTFLTPYFQRPLDLGADVVLHSGSKYLGGHNDTISGFLAVKGEALAEKLRFILKTTGAGLSPFDSFLVLRGIKTLPLRLEKAQENAKAIAQILSENKKIASVRYPGLPSHEAYELATAQMTGFGAMLSFSVTDAALVPQILRRVKLIQFAESLGGTESLITYPLLQTHADIPEAERLSIGIDDRLLRLSVGTESAKDLIEDLTQAIG